MTNPAKTALSFWLGTIVLAVLGGLVGFIVGVLLAVTMVGGWR